jgi:hypothetical protein
MAAIEYELLVVNTRVPTWIIHGPEPRPTYTHETFCKFLNEIGADGWELVELVGDSGGVFKRQHLPIP